MKIGQSVMLVGLLALVGCTTGAQEAQRVQARGALLAPSAQVTYACGRGSAASELGEEIKAMRGLGLEADARPSNRCRDLAPGMWQAFTTIEPAQSATIGAQLKSAGLACQRLEASRCRLGEEATQEVARTYLVEELENDKIAVYLGESADLGLTIARYERRESGIWSHGLEREKLGDLQLGQRLELNGGGSHCRVVGFFAAVRSWSIEADPLHESEQKRPDCGISSGYAELECDRFGQDVGWATTQTTDKSQHARAWRRQAPDESTHSQGRALLSSEPLLQKHLRRNREEARKAKLPLHQQWSVEIFEAGDGSGLSLMSAQVVVMTGEGLDYQCGGEEMRVSYRQNYLLQRGRMLMKLNKLEEGWGDGAQLEQVFDSDGDQVPELIYREHGSNSTFVTMERPGAASISDGTISCGCGC